MPTPTAAGIRGQTPQWHLLPVLVSDKHGIDIMPPYRSIGGMARAAHTSAWPRTGCAWNEV